MEKNDRFGVTTALAHFKANSGAPNFPALLAVPSADRLPALAKKDLKATVALVVVGIKLAMDSMNLSRPMNAAQIMDLAETVVESAGEDNLAMEDLMLFMQGLTRGKYGALYESMDIPKFMEKFDTYREERHKAILDIRYEQEVNHKCLPVNDRLVDLYPERKNDVHKEALSDYLRTQKPPDENNGPDSGGNI